MYRGSIGNKKFGAEEILDVALDAFVEVVTKQGEKGECNIDDLLDIFPAEGFTALLSAYARWMTTVLLLLYSLTSGNWSC